jgi:hypothetical protein
MTYASLFSKSEPGSAVAAANAMHASAHCHAIRYGAKGSKEYRQEYSKHIGRFLTRVRQAGRLQKGILGPVSEIVGAAGGAAGIYSAVTQNRKPKKQPVATPLAKSVEDERRDAMGRWAAQMEAKGVKLHGAGGITGLSRDQVLTKIKQLLDNKAKTTAHVAAHGASIALGRVGIPDELASHALEHGKIAGEHVLAQTGYIIGKVLEHPAFKNLATKVSTGKKGNVQKALEGEHCERLKNIVAGVMADTRLDTHVSCSDDALAHVACGAYRHLHDRICALRDSA